MISDSIALIAIAVAFGLEAYKQADRLPRIILTILTIVFAATGLLLKPLAGAVPSITTFVSSVFSQPAAWAALALMLYFVSRPYWYRSAATVSNPQTGMDHRLEEIWGALGRVDGEVSALKATAMAKVEEAPLIDMAMLDRNRKIDATVAFAEESLRRHIVGNLQSDLQAMKSEPEPGEDPHVDYLRKRAAGKAHQRIRQGLFALNISPEALEAAIAEAHAEVKADAKFIENRERHLADATVNVLARYVGQVSGMPLSEYELMTRFKPLGG